jgi:hypothetical protein
MKSDLLGEYEKTSAPKGTSITPLGAKKSNRMEYGLSIFCK